MNIHKPRATVCRSRRFLFNFFLNISPECHPERERAQSDRTSRSFGKGVRQAHEPIQNRKRDWSAQRDLQTVSGMSVQPWLHFFEDSRGRLSLQNIVFVGNISETYADPAPRFHTSRSRFCCTPFRSLLRNKRSAKLRLGCYATFAQDDTRGRKKHRWLIILRAYLQK